MKNENIAATNTIAETGANEYSVFGYVNSIAPHDAAQTIDTADITDVTNAPDTTDAADTNDTINTSVTIDTTDAMGTIDPADAAVTAATDTPDSSDSTDASDAADSTNSMGPTDITGSTYETRITPTTDQSPSRSMQCGGGALGENDLLDPNVPLDRLRLDGGTQSRAALDGAAIAEYTESIRQGATLPPLIAYFDGVDFWLADGFHRYHAYHAAGVDEVLAEVRTGSKRDAVLFSVGANAAHGLRRSNADKRRAVETLLADVEWAAWSDREIARVCSVSNNFVSEVRKAICHPMTDTPVARTVTRNGNTYEQKTANIGKARQLDVPVAPPAPELGQPAAPDVATARATPEQGEAAVTELAALLAENAELREEVADLKATLADTLADNEMMGRVFDADDQVKAAMAEATRHKALMENAERMLSARSQEFNERARLVVHWKNRAEKAEKLLAKAA
ncbi:MAG TPA: ParB N-terminal domain-containing protein [Telluria sp.]